MRAYRGAVGAVVAILGIGVSPSVAVGACENENLGPTKTNRATAERALLCMVNAERTKRGLNRLTSQRHLKKVARVHVRDMVAKGYFSHNDRRGRAATARVRRSGYLTGFNRFANLENIGFGFGSGQSSARGMMAQWMDDGPHRSVIIARNMRHAGISVQVGLPRANGASQSGATWVLEVARRSK